MRYLVTGGAGLVGSHLVDAGTPTTIAELAPRVMAVADRQVPVRHGPARAGDIRESVGDPGRARDLLTSSATTLQEGLGRLLAATAA